MYTMIHKPLTFINLTHRRIRENNNGTIFTYISKKVASLVILILLYRKFTKYHIFFVRRMSSGWITLWFILSLKDSSCKIPPRKSSSHPQTRFLSCYMIFYMFIISRMKQGFFFFKLCILSIPDIWNQDGVVLVTQPNPSKKAPSMRNPGPSVT